MSRIWQMALILSTLVAITLSIVLVWYSPFRDGDGGPENPRVVGIITYTVWDASGAVKTHQVIHNTTLALLLNDARDRIAVDGTTINNDALFDNIQLCSDNGSGAACTLSTNLDANPADGTNTALGESGNYQTVKTFTASGASTIEEMQLTRGTATNGVMETTRGAWQNVSITLASSDTLQVTWTVDID